MILANYLRCRSTLVIWSEPSPAAFTVGMRYLMVHLVLLSGIVWHVGQTGMMAFGAMQTDSAAQWLILA